MESEASATYPVGGGSPWDIAQIPDACSMEDLLCLDESTGHSPPNPQSAGDTGHSTIAGLRQAVLHPVGSGPTAATGAENLPEQNAHPWFGCPDTGAGIITQPLVVAMPEPDLDPYSTGDSSCCPSTTADMGIISSPDLEVNVAAVLSEYSQPGGGAASKEALVRGSCCKRKRLVCGSSSQRSTPPEFNLVELEAGLAQSEPFSDETKPPEGSTDLEILRFLSRTREQGCKVAHGKEEANRSLAVQDQTVPLAVRSYVTTREMMPDKKTHVGYWKEKQVETVRDDDFIVVDRFQCRISIIIGVKKTFQFHTYDGAKTNWFMHEYIPTQYWGSDLFMERLRFRVLEYKGGAQVPGEPTSPQVKIKNIIAAVKHRMRGPDDPKVVKGESPAWQHFIKIYDRHPELEEGSKVVYAVCCHCQGVLKAGTENGTKSLLTHCNRTCPTMNQRARQAS